MYLKVSGWNPLKSFEGSNFDSLKLCDELKTISFLILTERYARRTGKASRFRVSAQRLVCSVPLPSSHDIKISMLMKFLKGIDKRTGKHSNRLKRAMGVFESRAFALKLDNAIRNCIRWRSELCSSIFYFSFFCIEEGEVHLALSTFGKLTYSNLTKLKNDFPLLLLLLIKQTKCDRLRI